MTEQPSALDNATAGRRQKQHQHIRPISHRNYTTISTYNVLTLKKDSVDKEHTQQHLYNSKLHQLIKGCSKYGIELVAIQEHRWRTPDPVDTHTETVDGCKWRFDFCSASPQGTGGVGLLMSQQIAENLTSTERIADNIMKATFSGNPAIVVLVVHAPTEDKPDKVKDSFYNKLTNCRNEVPPHSLIIIAGDFNARIGVDSSEANPRVIGRHAYHKISNENGKRLVEFCETTDMRPTQTRFPHPASRLWTWQHPANRNKDNEHRSQIDHILINGKWINSIKNVRAYNTVELMSDHRIVSARIKISLRAPIGDRNKRVKFDWNKLHHSEILTEQFQLALTNRFASLPVDSDVQSKYDHFAKTLEEVALEKIGKLKKEPKKNWVKPSTLDVLDSRDKAKTKFRRTHTAEAKADLDQMNKKLEEAYKQDHEDFLEEKARELQDADRYKRLRTTWRLINEISNRKSPPKRLKVKRPDGTTIDSQEELLTEWRKYFDTLLNAEETQFGVGETIEPADQDLNINTGSFTLAEINLAVEQLQNGKSPGLDYAVTAEALKYGGETMLGRLCEICNDVFQSGKAPKQFTTALICPLPKKGDLSQLTNYRGISLMSVAAKVYNRVLLNRIRQPVDNILRENQAGFRVGRGCTEQVHVLRRLIESANDKNLPLYLIFVDFKKAFDSINRTRMFEILRHYGIPSNIVQAIQAIYKNSKSAVLVEGKQTAEFDVTTGVLQGDTLAPFLFIIVMDYVLNRAQAQHKANCNSGGFVTKRSNGRRHPEEAIFDLDFADDIALLEGAFDRAQFQLNTIADNARMVGLEINIKKTEALTNQQHNNPDTEINSHKYLELKGQQIEWVRDFKYLGSYVASSETDIRIRKGQAWGAFWKMKDVFCSKSLRIGLKMKIFKAACLTILLYGCESWILNEKLAKSLDSFATSCYRIMLNIKRLDKVTNDEVYKRVAAGSTHIDPLSRTVQIRQLKFVGHCLRKPKSTLINQYVLYKPEDGHGQRSRGRPRLLYPDYISGIINDRDPPTTDAIRATAAHRDKWRALVTGARGLR